MPRMKRHHHTYTGVCIYEPNRVYVPAISDKLAEEGMPHTLVFRWRDGTWVHNPIENATSSICTIEEPDLKVLNLGIDGEITLFTSAGFADERVDDSDEGPNDLLQLRCIRPIGARVYAAGLGRHVYRRIGPGAWQAIDEGVFVPRARRTDPVGFEAIDGLQENAIYAVGYLGEIWFYDGRRWIQQDSPTNVVLNCVRCRALDEVYIAGMAGTLLRGSNGAWEVIAQEETEEDFWGMTLFQDRIYVANYDGVFALDGDTLTRIDMGLGPKFSTAYLDARDGVMWSVGQKHLAESDDGVSWREIPRPS